MAGHVIMRLCAHRSLALMLGADGVVVKQLERTNERNFAPHRFAARG